MGEYVMLAAAMSSLAPTPERALGLVAGNPRFVGEVKLDGIRCLAHHRSGGVMLMNRRGDVITHRYPDVVRQLNDQLPYGARIDGEIVTVVDGRVNFAGAHRRDAQDDPRKIEQVAQRWPATFIAFDILTLEPWGSVRHLANHERRQLLEEELSIPLAPRSSDVAGLWAQVVAQDMEGIVVKDVLGRYETRRSHLWVKVKRTHRASVLVAEGDVGKGIRAETFGALRMQLVDSTTGRLVDVGRVGSGFSDDDVQRVALALADPSQLPLVVEVEYLEVSPGGQLRQPVYRGLRRDVALTACTTTQLRPARPI